MNPKLTVATVHHNNPQLINLWKKQVNKHFPNAKIIIQIPNHKLSPGSQQHGAGINTLIKKVDTEYILLLDSDCMLLSNFAIIDTLAAQKTKETIHMCFLAGRTDILNTYDFSPQGKGPSYKPLKDVGSRIPPLDHRLKLIDCKTGEGKLFGPQIQCDEIWLENKLIASHYGRGSNLAGKKVRNDRLPTKEQYNIWLKAVETIATNKTSD